MKSKLLTIAQWIWAILIILAVLGVLFRIAFFFVHTDHNNNTITPLVKSCEAKGGKIEMVEWEYGCARLEEGKKREVPCYVIECIGL